MVDLPAAARRLAALARQHGDRPGYNNMRDLAELLPVLDAVAAGRDDEGRVERWARELCRLSDQNPDRAMRDGGAPLWTSYVDDARAAIALADAERAAEAEAEKQSEATTPWARARVSASAGMCMCYACVRDRGEAPVTMRLCPECGNKRCPKASDHRLACTNSNAVGQPGSVF